MTDPEKLKITIVSLKDHPEWVPILASWAFSTWGKYNPNSSIQSALEKFSSHAKNDHSLPLSLIAIVDGKPVGMCSLRENDGYKSPLTPWLGSLYVLPEYRSHGIGETLVRKIIKTAHEMGFLNLFLYTFDPTLPRWYGEKLGFTSISEDLFLENAITVMQLSLS